MNDQNKSIKELYLTKYRASYKKFMGIPMNLENQNLKLLLEDCEKIIESSTIKNQIKISERFKYNNKK